MAIFVTNPLRASGQVNSTGGGLKDDPDVLMLADGTAIVSWNNRDTGETRAARIDVRLNVFGPDYSLGSASVENRDVDSAVLTNGNFVMAWGASTSSDIHVQAQVFAAPTGYYTPPVPFGGEITVGDSATADYKPSVAALTGGGFVVVWQQGYEGAGTDIHARVFNANGVQTVPDFVVNTTTAGNQVDPSVCALANGGFAVAWGNDGDKTIHARTFDAGGAQTATEFVVNSAVSNSGHITPTAVTNGDGFLVSWVSGGVSPQDDRHLHIRGFSSLGVETVPEINDGSGSVDEIDPVSALLQADGMVGGYVTVWVEPVYEQQGPNLVLVDFDIMGQARDLQGHNLGGRFLVNTGFDYFSAGGGTQVVQGQPAIASDAIGQFIVAFTEHSNDTQTGLRIAASGLAIYNTVTGATAGADELFGSDNPVVQDLFDGLDGNDILHGRGGRDQLLGRDGDDILIGGGGADRLYGENGIDTASYADAPHGVFADLTHTLGTTFYFGSANNDAQGDEYFYVENLTGSRFGDTLYGDSGANVINGSQGDDGMVGRGGGDSYIGGAGFDTVSYADATGASYMQIDLTNSAASLGAAAGDSHVQVERFVGMANSPNFMFGTNFDNVFVGGSSFDSLQGRGGNDQLLGLGGNDFLFGGLGDDLLDGGDGSDTASYTDATGSLTIDLTVITAQNVGGGRGLDTLRSIENLIGGYYADTLTGNGSDNAIEGGKGNDILSGAGGMDLLQDDYGDDHLFGGAGDDNLSGGRGNDELDGGDDADFLFGGDGSDDIAGGAGGDYATGGSGNDEIHGGAGADTLTGDANDDLIYGEAGNDLLEGGTGNDTLDGGTESDTASYLVAAARVIVDLSVAGPQNVGSGQGFDTLISIENLNGTYYNDILSGDGGNNVLDGIDGNDRLSGGGGADVLIGGYGRDILDGGAGADTFRFLFAAESPVGASPTGATLRDYVTAFEAGIDKFDFSAMGPTTFIGGAAFSNAAGEVRATQSATATLLWIDTDGVGGADMQVQIGQVVNLSQTDFV
jgi:Ca2+-binding RTX toxin-like protein